MPMFKGEKDLGSLIFVVLFCCLILPIMKVVWFYLILLNIPGQQTPFDLVIIYSSAFRSVGIRQLIRDEVSERAQSVPAVVLDYSVVENWQLF